MSVVALLSAGCAQATLAQAMSPDLDESWSAAIGPDGIQHVNIRCGADFLDPRNIVVRANVPVQLSVSTTADLAAHSFSVALGSTTIDAPVGPAQTSIVVSPRLSGRFAALCQDRGKPDGPAARKAKSGIITVLP